MWGGSCVCQLTHRKEGVKTGTDTASKFDNTSEGDNGAEGHYVDLGIL